MMMCNTEYYKVYDFLKYRKVVLLLSMVLIFFSCIVMVIRGFNWGLDFTGGIVIEISVTPDLSVEKIRTVLIKSGFQKFLIQPLNDFTNMFIQLPVVTNDDKTLQVLNDNFIYILRKNFGNKCIIKQMNWIGPSVNYHLIKKGMIALFTALICILMYITYRFEWRLATGIVLSLIHDLIIILGILSMFFIEIDSIIIAALMSGIGYSLNDNIVISDRIRENFCYMPTTLDPIDIFNISISQVLNRTIITSVTTIMVLIVLLIFGGVILHRFSIIVLFGIIIGTISSIYISSALALQFGVTYKQFISTN